MTNTTSELLTFAQAAARLNLGVLDVRRTEQCPPTVVDYRGRLLRHSRSGLAPVWCVSVLNVGWGGGCGCGRSRRCGRTRR
jgi:hypothetical protein